jgi:hypothetical protein
MSTSLYWRAAPPPPEPLGSADYPLKAIIDKLYHKYGAPPPREPFTIEADDRIVPYLEGYLDARDNEEVHQFLSDLRKHKRLEVWTDD